jgi:TolB-like protein/Flp pilus assembly protein TadD
VVWSSDFGTGVMAEEHTARLSLTLFAGFGLHDPAGASVRLPTRNARALLAFLAVQPGQPQSREKLMALLWGERSDKQARHSLNQTLVHIRKAVPGTDDRTLDSDRESVTCVPGSITVDALKFRELVAERPKEAMDLYKGPFLDGIGIKEAAFEDWLSAQRSELHGLACEALKAQCERFVEEGRHAEAIEAAKRLVTLDPLREDAHRQLMRLYHEAGDRTSALKQYQACAETLERELDVGPTSETTRLFDEIKSKGKGSGAGKGDDDPDRHFGIDAARAPGTGHEPSIAVLPFDNLSGEAQQEYFSDGVTEDIITELSRYPDFLVIARNSTFVYKHKVVDHRQISRDLGAQFVLEGSVRRAGKRVRITAQLVDTASGRHVWAERYDRTLDDIFAVQDEIIATIVSRLGDTLHEARIKRARRKDPSSLDAYDKTLQAWAHFNRFSKEDNREARRLAEEAIELEAGYARAHAIVAWAHVMDFSSRWAEDPDEALRQAYTAARKAVSLDDHNFYAYLGLGACETWLGRHDQAIANTRRAIELNPNDADTHAYCANHLVFAGRADGAIEELETAIRLNPYYPEWYLQFLGRAYFVQHRYEEAESAFERVVTVNPGWPWAHLILAATRAALGKTEEAEAEVAKARKISPALTLAHVPKAWPFKDPADLDHLAEMLREAGLSE